MTRLFAGTPWDRPPTCDRCGKPEAECSLPAARRRAQAAAARKPDRQAGHSRSEPRGKIVTVIGSLDPDGNDLPALAARLKASCGTGGTVKEGRIELQGDHLQAVETALAGNGLQDQAKIDVFTFPHRFLGNPSR